MDQYNNALKQYAADTEPSPESLDHYNRLLRARVQAAREPAPGWSLPQLTLGGGLIAAAAGLLLWAAMPPPQPAALAMAINSPAAEVTRTVTEDIELVATGTGTMSGDAKAPRYALTSGKVKFSVTPEQGIDLRVTTPEAEVRVLGTVFEVETGRLGTTVSVERGKVGVRCTDGTEHTLTKDETATCLPSTASGMLIRAGALKDGRAEPAAVIQATSQALEMGAAGDDRAEALALRMQAHVQAGQNDAALADARAYLETGAEQRRATVLNVAARLSAPQGCDAARPFLDELVALEKTEGLEPLIEACAE